MTQSLFRDRFYNSHDNIRLYAREYPATRHADAHKKPVICLHGLTRNAKDFDSLAHWLANQGRRVFVPDIRGRGRSEYAPDPMTYVPEIYVEDVLSLLRDAEIADAIFIGTSMGGMIIQYLAQANGERIAAAVLNDIGPVAAPAGLERIASYAGQTKVIESWDDAARYVRAVNGAAFPHFGGDDWHGLAHKTFREDAAGKPVFDYDPQIMVPIAKGAYGTDPARAWNMFAKLADLAPTLVTRGELSDILTPDIAEQMASASPTVEFAEIPGVGHAPFLDETASRAAIGAFLNRQR